MQERPIRRYKPKRILRKWWRRSVSKIGCHVLCIIKPVYYPKWIENIHDKLACFGTVNEIIEVDYTNGIVLVKGTNGKYYPMSDYVRRMLGGVLTGDIIAEYRPWFSKLLLWLAYKFNNLKYIQHSYREDRTVIRNIWHLLRKLDLKT
jgi:hypothetical protein